MAAPPISASTLKLLRDLKEAAMLDTVEIFGPGVRVDLPSGGWKFEAGDTVTTKGLIGPLSKTAIEQFQADRLEYKGLEQVEVPIDVYVSGQDKVSVTSERHGGTRQYTVEGVTPLGTYSVSRIVIVKAVA